MAQINVPALDETRLVPVRNLSTSVAIGANLLLVPDPSGARGVKLPVTGSIPTAFAGLTWRKIDGTSTVGGGDGTAVMLAGDVGVATASGTVSKGDVCCFETAATKEGRAKSYAGGAALIVGTALTDAADGELFELRLFPYFEAGFGVERQVRAVATSALAAYTRTAGAIQANANGALGSVFDGVTMLQYDTVLIPEGIAAAAADAGYWQITDLGSASTPFKLVRPEWYADGKAIVPGMTVEIGGEGTLFGGTTWKSFVVVGKVIDTDAPLLWPREVLQSAVLVAGTVTLSNVPIKSATKSAVDIQRIVANTSTATTGGYCPTNAGANGITAGVLGTGSIIIQACVAAGTINNADISTINVCVTNW